MLNINIPTKGRPGKLLQCLKSIDYLGEMNIFLSCYDAKEDIPCDELVYNCKISEDKEALTIETHNRVCQNEGHFIGLSDDITFYPGALSAAVKMLEKELDSDGIVDFTVANMKSPDGCYMMIGEKFISKFKDRNPYFPEYKFMFASAELRDYAKGVGRFKKCKEANLDHYHPSITKNPDETHLRIRSSGMIASDRKLYARRKKEGLIWGHMKS